MLRQRFLLMAFGAALLLPKLSIGQSSTDIDGVSGTGVQKKYDSNTGITSYNLNQQNFNGTDYYSTGGGSYNRDTYRSIMTFSLASIPAGSQIVEASVVYTPFRNNINISSSIKITKLNSGVPVGVTSEQWYGSIGNGTVVQNNIGNNVTTTVDVTDFVINANNSTDKNLYLGFISLSETTDYSLTAYNATLVVEYNPPPKITLENDFGLGILKADGLNISSGTIITNWAYDSNHNIEALSQTVGNIEYTFSNWTNGNDSYTSNPLTINAKSTTTWVAHFSSKKIISFYNKTESNENIANSKLFIDGSLPENEITSGDSKKLAFGSHPVKTKNETHNIQSALFKHNNWNDLKTDYKLSHSLNIDAYSSNSDVAKFRTLNPAIVSLALDGVPVSAPIDVKDPWFVEPDGTQPGNWKSYSAGFTPATMPNGGVFLNEDGANGGPKYYSRTSATTTLSGSTAWFQNWTGPAGSVASPTSLETAIIFKNANDVIKADFKGNLRTGSPELTNAVNQYRLLENPANDSKLLVYESMGEIWLTGYDPNTNTWFKEIRLSEGTGTAKNPSFSNIVNLGEGPYSHLVVAYTDGGYLKVQPVKFISNGNYGYSGELSFKWQSTSTQNEILSLAAFAQGSTTNSSTRPVVSLELLGTAGVRIWWAAEHKTAGLLSGYVDVDYAGNGIGSGIQKPLTGPLGNKSVISSSVSDQYPVLVYYPSVFGQPSKRLIYYLGTGYASGKRIVEYTVGSQVKTVLPVPANDYSYTTLSGSVDKSSASYVLAATAVVPSQTPAYNTNVYTKPTYYTGPSLSKVYVGKDNPTIRVQEIAYNGAPTYEVNMISSGSWLRGNGGASLTLISTGAQGLAIPASIAQYSENPAVLTKTETGGPSSLRNYHGTAEVGGGAMNKGESVLYADVRSVRNYTTLTGVSKTAILDFAGALVEPVDSLESGSALCAVKLISPDQNSIIVRQPDSIKTALAVDVVRTGVAIRSYSAGVWETLSVNSFEDVQDGDVLVFRLGYPVAASTGYEIYDFNGTNLTKPEETTKPATELKVLETGVAVYPNPFNPATSIAVSLESPEVVRVTVFNILGQLVTDFGRSDLGAGVHTFPFDGRLLASGTYFYRVEIGDKVKTGKLQLLK